MLFGDGVAKLLVMPVLAIVMLQVVRLLPLTLGTALSA
jgi:hypothetical protein